MASPDLYTIGYEGRTPAQLVATLEHAGVTRIVDVRALPLSRRPGFSKTTLAAALREHAIEYVHLRAAGNPYRAMKDDPERCLGLYAEYLDARPEIVEEVERALEGRKAALLCFEARHEQCHRSIIVARLMRVSARVVQHL